MDFDGARPLGEGARGGLELADLITDLQSRGVRFEIGDSPDGVETRRGGAGPSDSGMLWVEGVPVTLPTGGGLDATTPYVLREDGDARGHGDGESGASRFGDAGNGESGATRSGDAGDVGGCGSGGRKLAIYAGGQRLAAASSAGRPRYYDLATDDGIPYWKIALLHLDSLASTVLQTCTYWGNKDQCQFCGIGLSLAGGRTIAKKRPEQLAEVAVAAKELDGAVDATLTTGSTSGRDRGALYVAACGRAVKEASGLPVQVQFEPPASADDLDVIDRVHDEGIDAVGIHVESFDPVVLARVAPGKARTGIETYFAAWERAVALFGPGQVSTYVILGMGEDPTLTVAGCRRAVDMGVYPFVVPLRPIAGSLMADCLPPDAEYTESIYRQVVPYLLARGMDSSGVSAGCARCQACSAMASVERSIKLTATRPATRAG
ncbi:MAG: MSMEG_0568 family radical SAM protein [Acidimicrobiales bacterium]